MKARIIVAGGTGHLGIKIIKALIARGADVRAIVRDTTQLEKIDQLRKLGAEVYPVTMIDLQVMTEIFKDASCVVSALAGLHEVIVDTQLLILDAALAAGVPRFIPSDFASDFTRLQEGDNRNFDLRKEFHRHLDKAPIAATSIMNGAFADILSYGTPIYNPKSKSVGFWGDKAEWKIDFTTTDNVAEFTAAAALDDSTPRVLRIASFQISPKELAALGTKINGTEFALKPMGTLEQLSEYNRRERAANPEGENELYPRWQGSQYLYSMLSVRNEQLDNERYPGITWTGAEEVLANIRER